MKATAILIAAIVVIVFFSHRTMKTLRLTPNYLSASEHAASDEFSAKVQSAGHNSTDGKTCGMNDKQSIHAVSKVTVNKSEARPYDESSNPALIEIYITETFRGDIEGTSTVRALQARFNDGSASMVSMQRFEGKLHGRQGTFVLQGTQTVKDGKIKGTWFVLPGSGTGSLAGLCGNGGFEGEFAKGSEGTLDYWFD